MFVADAIEAGAAPGGPGLPPGAPAPAGLDLHEGIATQTPSTGCPRWPETLRLESTLGLLVKGRCKATNLCDYCAKLAAVENAEVLALDAMTNEAPVLWSVLTTSSVVADMAAYKLALLAAKRAVLRRWPGAEYATLIEFTTGLGTRSGGQRRPHFNQTWKGISEGDGPELESVLAGAWCEHVDAAPAGQKVTAISDTGGLMRYLALHFQKESQQPPPGFIGHRFRTSRGYLAQPMAAARDEARGHLRMRRELWKAEQAGLSGSEALEHAERAMYEAGELAWSLVRLQRLPTAFDGDDEPTDWVEVVMACS